MFFIGSKARKVDKIIKQISLINRIQIDNKNSCKIKLRKRQLHSAISEILFNAVKKRNYFIIDKILKSNFIRSDMVYDERHLDIVQYSLIENDNELFKILLNRYYKYIKCYFENVPSFFILIMNRRNFELMEIFLTDERLYKKLEKENICVCFYLAIQENLTILIQIILNNKLLESKLDGKDIQSVLIYSISHNQYDKVKRILKYDLLISKFSDEYMQNIIALILLNKDIEALGIIMDNDRFVRFVMKNKHILDNITIFAYSNNDIKVLSIILHNKKKIESLFSNRKCIENQVDEYSENIMIEDSI